jgi:SAM-dependent methyltransferase
MLVYEFIHPQRQIESADFQFVESFLQATGRTQLGWHYITDITWVYAQVKTWPKNLKILDAGGSTGPIQFLLAELGFDVTNIDLNLPSPAAAVQDRYQIIRQTLPSFTPTTYNTLLETSTTPRQSLTAVKAWLKKSWVYRTVSTRRYAQQHDQWRADVGLADISLGKIQWLVGNLCDIPEIPTASFDAIVSLSSLEHIPLQALDPALAELRRVLKPTARWAVTTSSTEQAATWFHEPSQGLCFSSHDLENRFGAQNIPSQQPAEVLEAYRHCAYLKDHLADFYRHSGNLGMPWGIWDPKYIPVGLKDSL